jgi:hypothetical protein
MGSWLATASLAPVVMNHGRSPWAGYVPQLGAYVAALTNAFGKSVARQATHGVPFPWGHTHK